MNASRTTDVKSRKVNELLFALNSAWAVAWYERVHRPFWGLHVEHSWLARHWPTNYAEPWALEQVLWSFILGSVIYTGFRVFARFWSPGKVFRVFTGAFAILCFPVLMLYLYPFSVIYRAHLFVWYHPQVSLSLALGEVLIALLCAILYYYRRWPLPKGLSTALLVLHFALWAWVTGSWTTPVAEARLYGLRDLGLSILISSLFYFGFPLIGFLSAVGWAKYLNQVTGNAGTMPAY